MIRRIHQCYVTSYSVRNMCYTSECKVHVWIISALALLSTADELSDHFVPGEMRQSSLPYLRTAYHSGISQGSSQTFGGDMRLFYSLDEVKNVFRAPEFAHLTSCKTILDVFSYECCPYERFFSGKNWKGSKHPFIVLEGNHRVSTEILSKRLAKMLKGSYYSMAPTCMIPYRNLFARSQILLRRAFFSMGVYVLGYQAAESVRRWPVVVNSYWNHQEIFALTKVLNQTELPAEGSYIYSMWPEDLIMPDILFYINFPDNLHYNHGTTRPPHNWKPRLLEFYRRLRVPVTKVINTDRGWDCALTEMKQHIIENLGATKKFSFRNMTFKSQGQNFQQPITTMLPQTWTV